MKKLIWFAPLMVLLVTQFNNCGGYVQTDSSELSSLGDLACDTDCILPNVLNLKIKPILFSTNFEVRSGLADFDLGGECNEGGFPYNLVTWELYEGNRKVRDSAMAGSQSSCVNGRFKVYVRLDLIAGDQISRLGLMNAAGTRVGYSLLLQVFGLTSPQGARNIGTNSRQYVSLVPVAN